MRRTALVLFLSAALIAPAVAQDAFYSDALSDEVTGMDFLQPGEYQWLDDSVTSGPVIVVVSLSEQRATVFRNGRRIAISTISSGKPGMDTPTGVFPILQKKKVHHSNLYDNAPMPFMQRLTWSGVALHAGHIPGHPASHGCVRLPKEFARRLFSVTAHGETVVVSDDGSISSLKRAGLADHLALLVGNDAATPEEQMSTLASSQGGFFDTTSGGALSSQH